MRKTTSPGKHSRTQHRQTGWTLDHGDLDHGDAKAYLFVDLGAGSVFFPVNTTTVCLLFILTHGLQPSRDVIHIFAAARRYIVWLEEAQDAVGYHGIIRQTFR